MSNSSSKGTALITGASRGIGAVYADRLAKRGYDLILVARSEAPLQALAATLSRSTGRRTTPIVADVNNKQDLARVEAKLKDDPSITMLVNNAGCASVAPLLDADIEKMEDMIALNISALTRMRGVKNESHSRLSWICQRVVPDATTNGFISTGASSSAARCSAGPDADS